MERRVFGQQVKSEAQDKWEGPHSRRRCRPPIPHSLLGWPLSPASPRPTPPQTTYTPGRERVWEKGPLCVPAKTQLLLNPNQAAFPNSLQYFMVSTFQMPSFNPEQKLLSWLIYNPDLLTELRSVPPLQGCMAGSGPQSRRPGVGHLTRGWHLSPGTVGLLRWTSSGHLRVWEEQLEGAAPGPTQEAGLRVTSRSAVGGGSFPEVAVLLQRGSPRPLSSEHQGSCRLLFSLPMAPARLRAWG